METIIVKPKSQVESKAILSLLKKMKVKTEVYREPSKQEILASIEKGAKDTAAFLKGKTKLRLAKDLLNEL
jgi:hypothetical protein